MLKTSVKIKSKKKSIEQVITSIEKTLPIAMEKIMEHGQQTALANKIGNKDKSLIPFIITKTKNGSKGVLYSNFEYAPFLEYGTGTKAELEHIGTTKTFIESGYRYWFLPKEVADAKGREFAPSRLININGNLFYIMYAQSPRPFMRPTAFDLEESALKILAEEIRKGK